jgi:hypothetical protein
MQTTDIIAQLDAEISRLQQAKALLNGTTAKRSSTSDGATKPVVKRVLSPEARAKIAAAQKKRWAKARKAA